MTREEIILMAEESTPDQMIGGFEFDYEQLLHFASLVAAAEREACANLCEEEYNRVKQTEAAHYRQTPEPFFPQRFGFNMSRVRMSAELADAIRARGQE